MNKPEMNRQRLRSIAAGSPELIEELDRLNPPRCIGATETEAAAHRRAGARELVEFWMCLLAESRSTDINILGK